MKFLVIGGGNIAHSLVAAISRWQDVMVLTRRPDDWGTHINDSPFKVCATNDVEHIADVDIIFVALPVLALREVLARIEPYLHLGQTICFIPANVLIPDLVERYFSKGVTTACFQRVPFIARIEEYGHAVKMSAPRTVHRLYVSQKEDQAVWSVLCRKFFGGGMEPIFSPHTFVFNNSNPLLHPSRLVVLFRDWRNKIFTRNPFFYAEWTDESSELYILADAEMHEVLRAVDLTCACERDYESVLDHYGVRNAFEMTAKIRSIESFKEILSPMIEIRVGVWEPDFNSRYFTEDYIGIRTIQLWAQKLNVATRTIDYFVNCIGGWICEGK